MRGLDAAPQRGVAVSRRADLRAAASAAITALDAARRSRTASQARSPSASSAMSGDPEQEVAMVFPSNKNLEALGLHNSLNVLDKWLDPDHIRLHAGEMTTQEMRSVLAVLRAV